ncbi:hypothetical protein GCM10022251_00910 [Phytohabitans flavus]|uniref:EF-hand domain-containing protein n=2 Tax=Phytohabitans flavus TaxID=1076124 RepID=A0A6F8Y3Y4_9ACTN|nr:hypothetical protein Pflav_071800 [Phytohabitans flavus]
MPLDLGPDDTLSEDGHEQAKQQAQGAWSFMATRTEARTAMSESQETVDTRGDERVDLLKMDTNKDGKTDLWAADTDGDGKTDLYQFDTDGDGKVNVTMSDLDEDGTPDQVVEGDGGLPPTS